MHSFLQSTVRLHKALCDHRNTATARTPTPITTSGGQMKDERYRQHPAPSTQHRMLVTSTLTGCGCAVPEVGSFPRHDSIFVKVRCLA